MSTPVSDRVSTPPASQRRATASLYPGIASTCVGIGAALLGHELLPQVGVLTWAVLLGAVAANLGALPAASRPGLNFATRKLLRVGVALLGLSLPLSAIVALGGDVIALVLVTVVLTLVGTTWLGIRLGLGRPRSLLIGTGFAICGASAIAAMQENAEADEDDVAVAVAMVTVFGTIAMVALPLLQAPLGLSDAQFGAWAGAGVHEVGQVVAATSPAGAAAVSVAVVVKLTRVLMLAPVVAVVGGLRLSRARRAGPAASTDAGQSAPLVPMFVVAFLLLVGVRSLGIIPPAALEVIAVAQTVTLGAALFGMGTAVHLRSLLRGSVRVCSLASVSTVVVGGLSLVGVLFLL